MTSAARLLPMLSVADLGASVAFYGDLLGGEEAYRFPPEDPVFLTLRFGAAELGIGAATDEPLHGRPQRPATGHRIELCVYVDDVDATVAAARGRGTEVVREPADQPWGERVAYLADPDGNLVMLAAPGG
jgi:lactoylglutathione lyase